MSKHPDRVSKKNQNRPLRSGASTRCRNGWSGSEAKGIR